MTFIQIFTLSFLFLNNCVEAYSGEFTLSLSRFFVAGDIINNQYQDSSQTLSFDGVNGGYSNSILNDVAKFTTLGHVKVYSSNLGQCFNNLVINVTGVMLDNQQNDVSCALVDGSCSVIKSDGIYSYNYTNDFNLNMTAGTYGGSYYMRLENDNGVQFINLIESRSCQFIFDII